MCCVPVVCVDTVCEPGWGGASFCATACGGVGTAAVRTTADFMLLCTSV